MTMMMMMIFVGEPSSRKISREYSSLSSQSTNLMANVLLTKAVCTMAASTYHHILSNPTHIMFYRFIIILNFSLRFFSILLPF